MADSEETASFDERRLATVGFKAGVEMTLTARRGGEGGTFKGRVGPLSLIEDKGGTTGHAASASPESRGKVELAGQEPGQQQQRREEQILTLQV